MLVSLVCLYFATRGVEDWGHVGAQLAAARPHWAALLVFFGVVVLWARVLRWRVLLRPLGDVPFAPAWSATVIGFGAGAVLPFRLGELVRPALLARKTGLKMAATISSIVLERLFDMLIVLVCLLVVSFTQPVPIWMQRSARVLAVGLVVSILVFVVVLRDPARAERLVEWLVRPLPERIGIPLRSFTGSFLTGLGALSDLRTVLLVLWYSLYVWGAIALTFLLALLTLDIRVPLLPAALTVMVFVAAAVFMPQAPGFIGTWQIGCVLALDCFGVKEEVAVGYSLLTWFVSMSVNLGLGGIFLAREDLSLSQLVRATDQEKAVDDRRAVGG